jgi:hypothetical protein
LRASILAFFLTVETDDPQEDNAGNSSGFGDGTFSRRRAYAESEYRVNIVVPA